MVESTRKGGGAMSETEARKAWLKEHVRYYSLKLQKSTDAAIIEKLESVESIQGYIKELIRQDIEKDRK